MPGARPETLLIVSHVAHNLYRGRIYAYGPYAREIDLWAELFPRVIIAAPCFERQPGSDDLAMAASNISVAPQRQAGGESVGAKIRLLSALPGMVLDLRRAMRRADAIHVRCPGNLGLLGVLMAPLYSRCVAAKYAGQWTGYPGEEWTVRLQRRLLASRWWRGPVTVYGNWPDQPANVVPFFTSMLSEAQIRSASLRREKGRALRVLFVGRLTASKNVHVLIESAAALRKEGISIECAVVGEGPERANLERLAASLGVADRVNFAGAVPLDGVLDFYASSDALVLASMTEGWPKVVAEAMAFGLVCIASDRGFIPEMLRDGRGIAVPPGDTEAVVGALRDLAKDPARFEPMRASAASWSRAYSLEGLRDALRRLLCERWGVELT